MLSEGVESSEEIFFTGFAFLDAVGLVGAFTGFFAFLQIRGGWD